MRSIRREARGRTVVVVGTWVAIPWLMVAGRYSRTIVWEHSLMRERMETTRSLKVLRVLARSLYKKATAVVCVSEPVAEDVRNLVDANSHVTTIPNIVEVDRTLQSHYAREAHLTRRARSGPMRLLTVGTLSRTKRADVALLALSRIPDATLTLVGDGPERIRLESLAEDVGVSHRVRFLGHRPHEEVIELMTDSDALVHPSIGETFGLVFFEAAERGLPVVAKRTRGSERLIPALVPGRLCDGSPTGIVTALEQVRADDSVSALDLAARARREFLSTEKILAAWSTLLQPPCDLREP